MNALALTISDVAIRQDVDGRFNLNDLHKAAGGEPKHQPANWLRNQQTLDLIEFLKSEELKAGIPAIQSKQGLGTFVVKELVYAYAMWISPAFSLKVIRAYDAQHAHPDDELVTMRMGGTVEHETAYPIDYTEMMGKYIALLEQKITQLETLPTQAALPAQLGGIRRWTREEEHIIREMRAKGYGYTRIGYQLGRSKNSVESHLRYVASKQGGV